MPYTDILKRRAAEKRYYYKNKQLYIDKNKRRKKELAEFQQIVKEKGYAQINDLSIAPLN